MDVLIFIIFCCLKFMLANSVDPDQMPHNAASELGLLCLHVSP